MLNAKTIRLGLLVLMIGSYAAGQETSQQPSTAPAPAFGQNAPILNPENPPLSGLDEPSLELRTSTRSFISPALQVGESYDGNPSNQLNGSNAAAISHVLGAFDLQKFWPKSDLFLEYLGGGAFGDSPYFVRQMHALGLEGVTRWRTGQLTLRDSFNYLPDGSFYAGIAGGLPGFGLATGGLGLGLPGIYRLSANTNAPGVGTLPRLSNTAILDAVQAINPRSAFSLVGAFSNSRFYHSADFVNGDQTTIEGGYSHLLSRHDQIAAVYAFQLFRFPDKDGGELFNHVIVVRWSHTISGRMSFLGEIGPQYTNVRFGNSTHTISPAVRAILRYKFERAQLMASYDKFVSEGSGLLAGANTQIAQGTLRRPLGRTFDALFDTAFAHNNRVQSQVGSTGISANSYNEISAGFLLKKHLSRSFDLFGAYRFSQLWFPNPTEVEGVTGRTNQRNIGTVGLEWHPRPTRIE